MTPRARILAQLADGRRVSARRLASDSGHPLSTIQSALTRLRFAGEVERSGSPFRYAVARAKRGAA